MLSSSSKRDQLQPMGPEPTLLSRKEMDALYETFSAVQKALDELAIDYIVTGGSLLGAIRQHSILFCDDDIDIAIIGEKNYDRVVKELPSLLCDYTYAVRPWEGGDRVRPKRMNSVFIDIFTLRRFASLDDLRSLIGVKANGRAQPEAYVEGIVDTIVKCSHSQECEPHTSVTTSLCPFWHFNTRKAIEMWPKEVYREHELFPLNATLKMGPLINLKGPRMPVLLLKRAFGIDCFDVYYQSQSHKGQHPPQQPSATSSNSSSATQPQHQSNNGADLKPLVLTGGAWEGGVKTKLQEEHYVPVMPTARAKRRLTDFGKQQLMAYLEDSSSNEKEWTKDGAETSNTNMERPNRTVYMDGVFDLFHIGHLEAIRQCAALGNRVILGVTGDADAASYKRPPIICESQRAAIVASLQYVDDVVCPCPLVVTEGFMEERGIDLVVHGFANDADAERQREFFDYPMQTDKFQRISYYEGLSTTDIIDKIHKLEEWD